MENKYSIGKCIICKQIKALKDNICSECNIINDKDINYSNDLFETLFGNLLNKKGKIK